MSHRAIVTGAAGFIASHLVEALLSDGYEVFGLDNLSTGSFENIARFLSNPQFQFEHYDVTSEAAPPYFAADEVYHLACPASPVQYRKNPVKTLRTCFDGTRRMLEVARHTNARFFLASTSEVYGEPLEHPQTETYRGNVNTTGPRSCYDEGKRVAESLAMAYAEQYATEVRIARIFNTYGPRMREDDGRVVSNFIFQALRGQPITLYGTGSQTRSFCYIDDLVRGIISLTRSDIRTPVNLGNPAEYTVRHLAETVLALLGKPVQAGTLVFRELPGDDPTRRRPDISKATELLGWQPSVSLRDGLALTVDDFRSRLAQNCQLYGRHLESSRMGAKRKSKPSTDVEQVADSSPTSTGMNQPEIVPLDDLRPHPRNYKTHPESQLIHLAESLRRHGFYRNIVCAQDGTILAGHGIVLAAKRAGFTTAPIYRLPISPDSSAALKVLTADNELGRFAESDDRLLSELLRGVLQEDETGLLGTGFDENMLAAFVMTTRHASEIADKATAAEWIGLPEYDEGADPIQLLVTFPTYEDRERFESHYKIKIVKKASARTWSTKWPDPEPEDVGNLKFRRRVK